MIDPVRDPDALIFSDSVYPGAGRMTIFRNGWTCETWFDSDRRAWVTEIKDLRMRLRDREDLVLQGKPSVTRDVKQAKWNHENAINLVIKDS